MFDSTTLAITIFIVAYALIISEKVHRTIVGIFGAMLMIMFGILSAWFNYNETRLGQGRDNAKIYLKEHPDLMDEIEAQVRANADKLTAKGKKGKGKAAEPAAAPAPAAEEKPAARPAARASEADLDIMVED